MKRTIAAAVLLVLALWVGYSLGHQNGVQEERRAWLATGRVVSATPALPSVGVNVRVRQASHSSVHISYTDPHSSKLVFSGLGAPWVNVIDPRTLQEHGMASP
jgi:hypothetical protein